ncbi:S8 family serine peptidase [Candidatus Margulisiibacteriota bacterium]
MTTKTNKLKILLTVLFIVTMTACLAEEYRVIVKYKENAQPIPSVSITNLTTSKQLFKNHTKEFQEKIDKKLMKKRKFLKIKNNKDFFKNVYLYFFDSQSAQESFIKDLKSLDTVEYVEKDGKVKITVSPNDPKFQDDTQWSLYNDSDPSADIDAKEGWDIEKYASGIVVAVIDTGIRRTHDDIDGNMWTNAVELSGSNGIDDDGNGYVDDKYGWDFANDDNDPSDDNGHGTHVAGIIGAEGNNSTGIAGVCWDTQIMAVKPLGSGGSGYYSNVALAIYYAVNNGADVLNHSYSGPESGTLVRDAIKYAYDRGVISCAASGNDGRTGGITDIPARYDEVVTVGATSPNATVASFSNQGKEVDVVAPGAGIYSLGIINDGDYQEMRGTSQATPHVAGLAALILAKFGYMTPESCKDIIVRGAVPLGPNEYSESYGHGIINMFNSLSLSNATIGSGRNSKIDEVIVFPNPAKDVVKIRILPSEAPDKITLTIYNKRLKQLKKIERRGSLPGYYTLTWDIESENGTELGNGIYLYHITVKFGSKTESKFGKIAVVK